MPRLPIVPSTQFEQIYFHLSQRVQQVEVVRALGAARLVPVPYVTESAQVHALLPVGPTAEDAKAARAFLRRWDALCLQRNANAALTIVRTFAPVAGETLRQDLSQDFASRQVILQSDAEDDETTRETRELRVAAAALAGAHGAATVQAVEGPRGPRQAEVHPARAAMDAAVASGRFARDALVLLLDVYMDFNDDFLNRVRPLRHLAAVAPLPTVRLTPSSGAGPHEHDPGPAVVRGGRLPPLRAAGAPAVRGRQGRQAAAAHGPLRAPRRRRAGLLPQRLRRRSVLLAADYTSLSNRC